MGGGGKSDVFAVKEGVGGLKMGKVHSKCSFSSRNPCPCWVKIIFPVSIKYRLRICRQVTCTPITETVVFVYSQMKKLTSKIQFVCKKLNS